MRNRFRNAARRIGGAIGRAARRVGAAARRVAAAIGIGSTSGSP